MPQQVSPGMALLQGLRQVPTIPNAGAAAIASVQQPMSPPNGGASSAPPAPQATAGGVPDGAALLQKLQVPSLPMFMLCKHEFVGNGRSRTSHRA